MAPRSAIRRFTVRRRIAAQAMPADQWEAVEGLLADLVARAYLADHPEATVAGARAGAATAPGDHVG